MRSVIIFSVTAISSFAVGVIAGWIACIRWKPHYYRVANEPQQMKTYPGDQQ